MLTQKLDANTVLKEHAATLPIKHGNMVEAVQPTDVKIEHPGTARIAVTNCPHCGIRLETYPFRDAWYVV
ncbi:hypothetical protein A2872_00515 [Candidatus Gottesmanbacteria bacterium RIFCSPHIGHO2_01_FULL_42_12]|uniref:Uncharacterized protein n=1 Tax=Candidatus Gottesmanbacteria bacterium RIFCSPHIGHO2_01_FULL_42_12 TaxID=1798377 RepID=A0A1F5Z3B0_9BACT|nr:MAG: hypothetical protein A2872_00515 [Candidatus Gottesmanbacteria bacterium RIFCSPHIGHO2_01_FULL_42_12]